MCPLWIVTRFLEGPSVMTMTLPKRQVAAKREGYQDRHTEHQHDHKDRDQNLPNESFITHACVLFKSDEYFAAF
jgi:hypothetical protein